MPVNELNEYFAAERQGGFPLVALALAVFLRNPGTWASVGLGLLVEPAVPLVFDAFARRRALVYTQWPGRLS